MRKVLSFAIAAVMPFVMAGALLTPRTVTASLPDERLDAPDEWPVSAPGTVRDLEQEDHSTADIFGNPVTSAVATYQLDAAGSLYELHSPQTELPRLAPPKS